MTNQYGPWATAIEIGPQTRLSTFWRRRLTRLPAVARSKPAMNAARRSRRSA